MSAQRGRDEALASLAESREQLRRLFEPDPGTGADGTKAARGFPRSRTMRALTSGRGLGTVAAIGGSLLFSRPIVLRRVLRIIPVGALAKFIVVKLLTRASAKHEHTG
jgi:hypothetical protein